MIAWNSVQIEGIPKGWNNETNRGKLETELKNKDNATTATLNGNNIKVTYKGYETTINVNDGTLTELAKSGEIVTGGPNYSNDVKTKLTINLDENDVDKRSLWVKYNDG